MALAVRTRAISGLRNILLWHSRIAERMLGTSLWALWVISYIITRSDEMLAAKAVFRTPLEASFSGIHKTPVPRENGGRQQV